MNKLLITIITVALVISISVGICFSQDLVKERIELTTQFAIDIQNGKTNDDVFKEYLESKGDFNDPTVEHAAIGWTRLLRESLKNIPASDIEVYRYADRAGKGKQLKPVEDATGEMDLYVPLEFELHTKDGIAKVNVRDLFVLRLYDEKVYVLFNDDKKMITWFGLAWGHKVTLMKF